MNTHPTRIPTHTPTQTHYEFTRRAPTCMYEPRVSLHLVLVRLSNEMANVSNLGSEAEKAHV